MTHTKGKWIYRGNSLKGMERGYDIYSGDKLIAEAKFADLFNGTINEAEANAQRIVECVNGYEEVLKSYNHEHGSVRRLEEYQKELISKNAKLREALKNALTTFENGLPEVVKEECWDVIADIKQALK